MHDYSTNCETVFTTIVIVRKFYVIIRKVRCERATGNADGFIADDYEGKSRQRRFTRHRIFVIGEIWFQNQHPKNSDSLYMNTSSVSRNTILIDRFSNHISGTLLIYVNLLNPASNGSETNVTSVCIPKLAHFYRT